MSGKTIYIKMIAVIQIMAQIGCFVPAKSAQLRMTDKIFSRIGFQDNIEASASSFTVELREMEYIYSNVTPNSLVIMDELCRSTNPQEGEVICYDYCKKLLSYIGVSDGVSKLIPRTPKLKNQVRKKVELLSYEKLSFDSKTSQDLSSMSLLIFKL